VHRSPSDGRYDSITVVEASGTMRVAALPSITISADRIFV
jgi:hypothetical protein